MVPSVEQKKVFKCPPQDAQDAVSLEYVIIFIRNLEQLLCKISESLKSRECQLRNSVYCLTIGNAVAVLQDTGALSVDETSTELGEKIGCLPVHPLTTKMFLFSMLMNYLDPALTLACASDYISRDPFTLPMLSTEKKRATAAKFELASLYGGHSDQLAVIAAFECWKNAKNRGSRSMVLFTILHLSEHHEFAASHAQAAPGRTN
ncbi:hypothetical protein OIU84_013535 [Salix udensis]|uniref:RNA helicase n=1 Tax=Salix udensis TaxID=889485 RepID=A0AAD6JI72_9ROSI|nr:hypothetical protein OIU84_013535 [Salix udensis]